MPLILDMILDGGALRIWGDRENMVHIADDLGQEITVTADRWQQLVAAVRRGDWEKRS